MPILLNHDNGTIPVELVERAAWVWNLRTSSQLKIEGTTSLGCLDDSIVVRRASVTEWLAAGYPLIGFPTALTHDCQPFNSGYGIVFGPDLFRPITTAVLAHELGHAQGIRHLNNPNALMYGEPWSPYFYVSTVTQVDALEVGRGDLCSIEILENLDLFIPDYQGLSYFFKFKEGVWEYSSSFPSSVPCNTVTVEGGRAVLEPRGFGYPNYRAVLERSGAVWRLLEVHQDNEP